jgi:antirestriction protein
MMTTTVQPRIYVACLAAYNNGILHGRWIDADQDADDIWTEINAMLAASPIDGAEEHAIHDHEYMGKLGEYESIEKVAEIGQAVAEHGEAFLAWLEVCDSAEETAEHFQDAYRGEWSSEREYVEQEVSELGWAGISPGDYVPVGMEFESRAKVNVLEALESYLDWDSIARERFDHGPLSLHNGHVFDAGW